MIKKSIFICFLLMVVSVVVLADSAPQEVVTPVVLEATQVFTNISKSRWSICLC